MRRIRKIENMRDDPVLDKYLNGASRAAAQSKAKDLALATGTPNAVMCEEERLLLRRMSETGAVLVVSGGMEKAIVLRTGPDGQQTRTAVVRADLAASSVLRDWIRCSKSGRVSCYNITDAGRMALKRALAETGTPKDSPYAAQATPFSEQHKIWGERRVAAGDEVPQRLRVNLGESPLTMLARKRDREGKTFLSGDLVEAGDRLREDFELSQMGPRVGQNWEKFLTGGVRGEYSDGAAGFSAAQDRLARALKALGPGLADVALRCCCFLEGLETAERRMGWSARSGKIVLRIALQRLRLHYDRDCPPEDTLIG
ncbi:MAG: DUF6456 domain-containing protein [Pseudomonadota bacterium]